MSFWQVRPKYALLGLDQGSLQASSS